MRVYKWPFIFQFEKKTEKKLHVPKPFVFSNKNENKK